MAGGRIKGITIEINGDSTKLTNSLKQVDDQLQRSQSKLKDVNKLLKLDPGNTELLKQKYKELDGSIKSTEDRLKTLKTASEEAAKTASNYDAWKAKYDPIQQEISDTQDKLKKLKEDAQDADRQLASGQISQDKYDALQAELKDTSDHLKDLKQQAQAVDEEFGHPVSPEQWDALQREIADTETQLRSLNTEMDHFGSVSAQSIAAAGSKVQEVGGKIEGAGKTIMPVSAAVLGIGAAAVKTTADFDSQLSKIKAIAGEVSDEALPAIVSAANEMGLQFTEGTTATETAFNILRAKAREMGAETKFSASEAGAAMEYMAMAGWKTGDMLDGIEGIMNLAAASGENLATTSDIVTDALTAFGLTAGDSGHFADILAAASSNANTNVSMMGETFKYAAPVAGALGYSAEDTALAIGLMANAGIKSSQAGTSLRRILINLASPTDSVQYGMDKLGISMTDASGKVKPFRQMMEELRQSFNNGTMSQEQFSRMMEDLNKKLEAGDLEISEYAKKQNELEEQLSSGAITQSQYSKAMEDLDYQLQHGMISDTGTYEQAVNDLCVAMWGAEGAQKAELAASVAGKNGMSGLLAIINASEDDWNKLSGAIDNCEGSAKEMSEIMNDNLEGQITILKSQLAELAISIGDILVPMIRNIVTWIQGVVDWLNNMDEDTRKMVVTIGLVVAAAGPLLIFIGKLTTAVGSIMTWAPKIVTAFGKIKGAFSGLVGLIAAHPVLAAVTALVAGIVWLYNNCQAFHDAVKPIWEGIKAAIMVPIQAVADFFKGIFSTLVDASGLPSVGEAIEFIFLSAYSWVRNRWIDIVIFFRGLWTNIQAGASEIWGAITEYFAGVWQSISDKASEIWNSITEYFTTKWQAISEKASEIWNGVVEFFAGIWEVISTKVSEVWSGIQEYFSTTWQTIRDKAGEVWSGIQETVTAATDAVGTYLSEKWDAMKAAYEEHGGGLEGIAAATWTGIQTILTDAYNAINDLTGGKLDAVKQLFTDAWEGAKKIVSDAITAIKGFFNFEWKLPHIALPHFSIKGEFSLMPPKVPKIGVEWYRKAMDAGMILTNPTIFGMAGGRLLGGGEAGPEAIIGTNSLSDLIENAVARGNVGQTYSVPRSAGQSRILNVAMYIKDTEIGRVLVPIIDAEEQRVGVRLSKGGAYK